ncbi:MAG: J domain-containing protein [Bacteroidota bacterium]
MRTYYDILGVEPDCEPDRIKAAFRRLALDHHPDRASTELGQERFLEIREAYEILSDPARRAAYDVHLVAEHPDFAFVPGHAPEADPPPPESGPRQSGNRGFGYDPADDRTPFMFLVWLLPPIIIAGLLQEFVGEAWLTVGSIPVVLGVVAWLRGLGR